MAAVKRTYTKVSECDVTVQWVYNWANPTLLDNRPRARNNGMSVWEALLSLDLMKNVMPVAMVIT